MILTRIDMRVRLFWLLPAAFASLPIGATGQSAVSSEKYQLPAKELKLDAKHRDEVLSAKTVAVLAATRPLTSREGKDTTVVTYRGRRVGPEWAKADVENALEKWGRFTVVGNLAQADLILVVAEETLPPSFFSKGLDDPLESSSGPRYRLRDTLGVFSGRAEQPTKPLWVGLVTENAFAGIYKSPSATPSATGVIEKFRRVVEEARKRSEK